MKVTVVCFGALRDYLPPGAESNSATLELDTDARVRDMVEALGAPHGLVHAVLVDGRSANADHELVDGAEVTLMPPFTGG